MKNPLSADRLRAELAADRKDRTMPAATATKSKTAKPAKKATPAKPPVPDKGKSVLLLKDKDCKHSVRYATAEYGKPVSNAYVNRVAFPNGMPAKVKVTIYGPGDMPEGADLPDAVVAMVKKKDCQHSVHYEKNGPGDARVTSLYVNRTAFEAMPAAVAVCVEPA